MCRQNIHGVSVLLLCLFGACSSDVKTSADSALDGALDGALDSAADPDVGADVLVCTPDCADKCAGAADGCGQPCKVNLCVGCCDKGVCKAACPDTFWFAPRPFYSGRVLSKDFRALGEPANLPQWAQIRKNANGFKSYLMVLPLTKAPEDLQDSDLQSFGKILSDANLQVAFEVGGLRVSYYGTCEGDFGKKTADTEFKHLERWLTHAGKIDFLTSDHAIVKTLSSRNKLLSSRKPNEKPCLLNLSETIDQLMEYFARMAGLFKSKGKPVPKFGVIESLGNWEITGSDGHAYTTLNKLLLTNPNPGLPPPFTANEIKFATMFKLLTAAAAKYKIALHHFDFDFGAEGVYFDGKRRGWTKWDYGRLLAIEKQIKQSSTVEVGLIVNAFHSNHPYVQKVGGVACYRSDNSNNHLSHCTLVGAPGSKEAKDAVLQANKSGHERSSDFLKGYYLGGGKSRRILAQSWMPHPDRILPETTPYTYSHQAGALFTLTQP